MITYHNNDPIFLTGATKGEKVKVLKEVNGETYFEWIPFEEIETQFGQLIVKVTDGLTYYDLVCSFKQFATLNLAVKHFVHAKR